MDSDEAKKEMFKAFAADKMRQQLNEQVEWVEMDEFEVNDNNMEELINQGSKQNTDKNGKQKVDRKQKKGKEVEQYQNALVQLRSENKVYYRPFEKQRLNISVMQAIKMLKDAIDNDKDFVKTLRKMGCKTRMRVRNKTAARELFEVMLKYLEQSALPTWMHERHKELLMKDDSKFDNFVAD